MASAYRARLSHQTSDESSNPEDETSDKSSETIGGDTDDEDVSDDEPTHAHSLSQHTQSEPPPLQIRNRVLMLTSRGVSYRHRHLLNDLHSLLPHAHKDSKLDTKSSRNYNEALNALADLHSCNYIFFLEARKRAQDLYLWLAKSPNGPTIKFSITNIHTMGEMGFGGNCLKGGRGVVVFDQSFDDQQIGLEVRPLIREMLRGVFCVPSKGARGMKPFIDRVIGVYGLDDKIWIRVYEIRETAESTRGSTKSGEITLVEIGPRFVLTPVLVLESAFGGAKIYENRSYISGNQVRSLAKAEKAQKLARRERGHADRRNRKDMLGLTNGKKQLDSMQNSSIFM